VSLKRDAAVPVYADGPTMHFKLKDEFQVAQSDTTLKGPHNLINTMAAVSSVYLAVWEWKISARG